jgi:hypothetical protein
MYKTLLTIMLVLALLTALGYGLIARLGVCAIAARRLIKRTRSFVGTAAVRDGLWLTALGGSVSVVALALAALIARQ